MSEQIVTEIEEHICNLWLLNESSMDALAKKQTLANHKLRQTLKEIKAVRFELDNVGFTVGEFLAWLCLSLGIIMIAMAIIIWGWPL